MVFYPGVVSNPNGRPKWKYEGLERPWNRRYSRMKAQAKYRGDEWALSPQEYMQLWEESGVKEHCGAKPHQYCMVRKDPTEAWSYSNTMVVSRRLMLRKVCYETWHGVPPTDWQDKHGVKNGKKK